MRSAVRAARACAGQSGCGESRTVGGARLWPAESCPASVVQVVSSRVCRGAPEHRGGSAGRTKRPKEPSPPVTSRRLTVACTLRFCGKVCPDFSPKHIKTSAALFSLLSSLFSSSSLHSIYHARSPPSSLDPTEELIVLAGITARRPCQRNCFAPFETSTIPTWSG